MAYLCYNCRMTESKKSDAEVDPEKENPDGYDALPDEEVVMDEAKRAAAVPRYEQRRIERQTGAIRRWVSLLALSLALNAVPAALAWDHVKDIINAEFSIGLITNNLAKAKNKKGFLDGLAKWQKGRDKGVTGELDVAMVIKKMEAFDDEKGKEKGAFLEEQSEFIGLYSKFLRVGNAIVKAIEEAPAQEDGEKSYKKAFQYIADPLPAGKNYDKDLKRARHILIHGMGDCTAAVSFVVMAASDLFGDKVKIEIGEETHVDQDTREYVGHFFAVATDLDGKRYRIEGGRFWEVTDKDLEGANLRSPQQFIKGYLVANGKGSFEKVKGKTVVVGGKDGFVPVNLRPVNIDFAEGSVAGAGSTRLVMTKNLAAGLTNGEESSEAKKALKDEKASDIAAKYGVELEKPDMPEVDARMKVVKGVSMSDVNPDGIYQGFTDLYEPEVAKAMVKSATLGILSMGDLEVISLPARRELAKYEGRFACPAFAPLTVEVVRNRIAAAQGNEIVFVEYTDLHDPEVGKILQEELNGKKIDGRRPSVAIKIDGASPEALESFRGRTFNIDVTGQPRPEDIAILSNNSSQREIGLYPKKITSALVAAVHPSAKKLDIESPKAELATKGKPGTSFLAPLKNLDLGFFILSMSGDSPTEEDLVNLQTQENLETALMDFEEPLRITALNAALNSKISKTLAVLTKNKFVGEEPIDFGAFSGEKLHISQISRELQSDDYYRKIYSNIGALKAKSFKLYCSSFEAIAERMEELQVQEFYFKFSDIGEIPLDRFVNAVQNFKGERISLSSNGNSWAGKIGEIALALRKQGLPCWIEDGDELICDRSKSMEGLPEVADLPEVDTVDDPEKPDDAGELTLEDLKTFPRFYQHSKLLDPKVMEAILANLPADPETIVLLYHLEELSPEAFEVLLASEDLDRISIPIGTMSDNNLARYIKQLSQLFVSKKLRGSICVLGEMDSKQSRLIAENLDSRINDLEIFHAGKAKIALKPLLAFNNLNDINIAHGVSLDRPENWFQEGLYKNASLHLGGKYFAEIEDLEPMEVISMASDSVELAYRGKAAYDALGEIDGEQVRARSLDLSLIASEHRRYGENLFRSLDKSSANTLKIRAATSGDPQKDGTLTFSDDQLLDLEKWMMSRGVGKELHFDYLRGPISFEGNAPHILKRMPENTNVWFRLNNGITGDSDDHLDENLAKTVATMGAGFIELSSLHKPVKKSVIEELLKGFDGRNRQIHLRFGDQETYKKTEVLLGDYLNNLPHGVKVKRVDVSSEYEGSYGFDFNNLR
jgi:hypothetical protein